MIYLICGASVFLFALLFRCTGTLARAREALPQAAGAFSALRQPGLTDDDREAIARAGSIHLFRAFFSITARLGLVALAPACCVAIAVWALDLRWADVVPKMASWPIILFGSLAFALACWRR